MYLPPCVYSLSTVMSWFRVKLGRSEAEWRLLICTCAELRRPCSQSWYWTFSLHCSPLNSSAFLAGHVPIWNHIDLESDFHCADGGGKSFFFVLLLQNQVRGQPLCLRVSSTERENVFGRHQRLLCFYFLCLCFSSCFVKEISYFLLFFFVQTEIKSQLGERAEGEGNVSLSKRCARTLSTTVTVK